MRYYKSSAGQLWKCDPTKHNSGWYYYGRVNFKHYELGLMEWYRWRPGKWTKGQNEDHKHKFNLTELTEAELFLEFI